MAKPSTTPSPKAFPVFRSFEVRNFGLYPGTEDDADGVRIDFFPGITLIVGANGLGKTTLITMLFRMITGPFDIPQLRSANDLGFGRLEARKLPTYEQNTFAARCFRPRIRRNGPSGIRNRIQAGNYRPSTFELGSSRGSSRQYDLQDEETFQTLIVRSAGLGSFGDPYSDASVSGFLFRRSASVSMGRICPTTASPDAVSPPKYSAALDRDRAHYSPKRQPDAKLPKLWWAEKNDISRGH